MDTIFENLTNNASSLHIAIGIVALTIIYLLYSNRSLPPGPTGLPYFGYWPFWKKSSSHLQLHELGKKYGDVFSFNITGQLYINLGSHKVVREAVVAKSSCFADRPQYFTVANMCLQDGMLFLNGEKWKVIRKFFMQQFRESGMNRLKKDGEGVYESIKRTVDDLYKSNGQPLELVNMLTDKCTTILYATVFGERGVTVEEIKELNNWNGNVFSNLGGVNFLLAGNIVRYLILPFMPSYWTAMKYFNFIRSKLYEIIYRHSSSFDETNIRNLIDAYLNERKIRESNKDPTAAYFTDKSLMSTLFQVAGDGVVTVAMLISASIQALLDHPEEQEKIYRELVDVIGLDRDPSLEDKSKLPYTNAFISEVQRMTDVFPFFPDMECTKETTIHGYRIPKGAVTVMNIWCCHQDPREYEDPEKFNPSRFLPAEGKKKVEQPILFGLGKRTCIGEGYTMLQVFLFLTTIVKHFKLSKPKNIKNKGLLFLEGTVYACAHPRND